MVPYTYTDLSVIVAWLPMVELNIYVGMYAIIKLESYNLSQFLTQLLINNAPI